MEFMPVSFDLVHFLGYKIQGSPVVLEKKAEDGMSLEFKSMKEINEMLEIFDSYYQIRGFEHPDNSKLDSKNTKNRTYLHVSGSFSRVSLKRIKSGEFYKYKALIIDFEGKEEREMRQNINLRRIIECESSKNN